MIFGIRVLFQFKNLKNKNCPWKYLYNNNIYVLLEKTVKVADDEVYIAIEFYRLIMNIQIKCQVS